MSAGVLYIVPTPIGNLGDMVPRALEVLQTVSIIFAEDTRHSKKLLNHFAISTPLKSFHEHSNSDEAVSIIQRVQTGKSVAIISDAGTPLISDPGYQLVKLAHEQQVQVVPIPGACAAIAALSASGLPSDRFYFEGFLPAKSQARQQRLQHLKDLAHTVIIYESPHRILSCIEDCYAVLGGERSCTVAREISKHFETIRTGSLAEIKVFVESDANQQRGEFVLLLAAEKADNTSSLDAESEKVLDVLLTELSIKQASALAAKISGKPKRALYDLALTKAGKK